MTFDEFLAALPTSDHDDWRAAAERQLRGRPLGSIDFALAPGLAVPPYASADGSAPRRGGLPARSTWTIMSDLPEGVVAGDESALLRELEWGAQGFALQAPPSGAAARGVRFDYLTTAVPSGKVEALARVVPSEQRAGARVWVSGTPAELGEALRAARRDFPGAQAVLQLAGSTADPAQLLAGAVADATAHLDAEARAGGREGLEPPTLAFGLGASYPRTVVALHALDVWWAQNASRWGIAAEAAPLGRWVAIAPEPGTSHEDYLIDASARAVAAASAGVDAMTVRPFGDPRDATARRRALNLQHVLAIEGGFQHAAGATVGSAFVEQAAHRLLEHALPGTPDV